MEDNNFNQNNSEPVTNNAPGQEQIQNNGEVVQNNESIQNNIESVTPMSNTNNDNSNNVGEKKKNNTIIFIAVIAVLVIVIIVLVLKMNGNKTKENNNINTNQNNIQNNDNTNNNSSNNNNLNNITSPESNTFVKGSKDYLSLFFTGDVNSGKEEVLSTVTKVYGKEVSASDIEKCAGSVDNGILTNLTRVKISVGSRKMYFSYNCGFADFVKSAITGRIEVDGAILVVKASAGIQPQLREELSILNKVGASKVSIYINDDVSNDSAINLVKDDVKELLKSYNFDPNATPMTVGKANDTNAVKQLIEATDKWIESPQTKEEKPFLMGIEDVFTITGRGTVVTGRVETGKISVNNPVEIVGIKDTQKSTVTSVEMFQKTTDKAVAGDTVGIILSGINREDVERGQVLSVPGGIKSYKKFNAIVYILSKEEGGRHTPFFNNYRPQFYFRTTDVTGVVTLPEGTEMVMPGDNVDMTVELITPMAIEKGTYFSIREGGRTVGAGIINKVIE